MNAPPLLDDGADKLNGASPADFDGTDNVPIVGDISDTTRVAVTLPEV